MNTQETLHDRLKQALAASGLSAEQASRAAGLDKTYLRKLFEAEGSSPRTNNLAGLASAMNVNLNWLMTGNGAREAEEVQKSVKVARPDIAFPARAEMPNDIPVMGTAAGSVFGSFQLESGPIDYVRRPPALSGAAGIYALYIEGTSMEPEHRPGDLRFVHPHKPPRIGDSVIVQMKNHEAAPSEAIIGHLLRKSGDKIAIGKLSPQPKTVEISMSVVLHVHKVLTMNELFGV